MKDYSDVSGIAVTSGSSGERIKWLIDKLGESGEVPVYSLQQKACGGGRARGADN